MSGTSQSWLLVSSLIFCTMQNWMNDLVFLCVWNQDDPIDFGNLFIETETAINENAKSALPTKRFRFHRSRIWIRHSSRYNLSILINHQIRKLRRKASRNHQLYENDYGKARNDRFYGNYFEDKKFYANTCLPPQSSLALSSIHLHHRRPEESFRTWLKVELKWKSNQFLFLKSKVSCSEMSTNKFDIHSCFFKNTVIINNTVVIRSNLSLYVVLVEQVPHRWSRSTLSSPKSKFRTTLFQTLKIVEILSTFEQVWHF